MAEKLAEWVDVGGGAQVCAPYGELEWQLRYGSVEKARYVAASAVATLRYLALECSQKEQVRRLKFIKEAIL